MKRRARRARNPGPGGISAIDVDGRRKAPGGDPQPPAGAEGDPARPHTAAGEQFGEVLPGGAEELFRSAFGDAPIGMALVSPDGRFLRVNRALCQITGYPAERLLELTFADITHPDDLAKDMAFVRACLTGQLRTYEITKRYFHLDGHAVWVQLNVSLVSDAAGRPAYFISQIQDITRRIKAEQDLKSAEAQFRTLVEQLPAVIYVDTLGPNAHTSYVSPQSEQILGVRPEEVMSSIDVWKNLIHPDDRARVLSAVDEHDQSGQPFNCEYRIVTPKGRLKWLRDEAVIIRDEEGEPLFSQGVLVDITERRELEQQLLQSQKMEAVGRLAGGVAHDFNNLLAVIQNYAGFLAEDIDQNDPRREDVEEIRRAGERAANLVRQLLTFSRKELVKPEILNVNDIVTDMEKLLRRTIGEDVELLVETDPTVGTVRMDVGQVEQVLANLVVNARDAMPDGGTIKIRTARIAHEGGWLQQYATTPLEEYACLTVTDTGPGMSEEVAARVFEPFFTTKPKDQGTGLGLAITHGIVEQARGHISVDSIEGEGTTFRVYVPVTRAAGDTEPDGDIRRRATGQGGRVLVVEDEPAVRAIVRRVLTRAGFEVIESEPRDAAAHYMDPDLPIDVLLTDVIMPDMSGREVADAVRAAVPSARVIFMSGYTDDVVQRQGVVSDEAPLIQKPFTAEELVGAIESVLRPGEGDPHRGATTPEPVFS